MNVFHCCVQKTASQWIASIFNKSKLLDGTDFEVYDYYKEAMQGQDEFVSPRPNAILTPIYASYSTFQQIPKPEQYKVFMVIRDPRDIVVSWYFSATLTHKTKGNDVLHGLRQDLKSLTLEDGLIFSIEKLGYLFENLRSWQEAESKDARVKLFKYEDLTQENQFSTFKSLLEHCEILVSDDALQAALAQYSFKRLTRRQLGQEDVSSHFRKGMEGDWMNYFSEVVSQKFSSAADSLPTDLGYQSTEACLLKQQYSAIERRIEHKEKALSSSDDDLPIPQYAQRQIYALHAERDTLKEKTESLKKRLGDLEAAQRANQDAIQQLSETLAKTEAKLAGSTALVASLSHDLETSNQVIERARVRATRAEARNRELRQKLETSRSEAHAYQSEVEAMKTSKFWKLRSRWMQLKCGLKLAKPEQAGSSLND